MDLKIYHQPLFFNLRNLGVLADNSKSRFGRRRPYMIGASLICAVAMLLLGYARNVSSILVAPKTTTVRPHLSLLFLNSCFCAE